MADLLAGDLGDGGGGLVGFGDDWSSWARSGAKETPPADWRTEGGGEIADGGGGVSEDLRVAFLLDDQAGFDFGVGH